MNTPLETMPIHVMVGAMLMAFIMGASIFSFYIASASRVLYFFYGPARKQLSYGQRWKEFFTRRSFCDDCEMPIPPLHVIPVLGYFFARRHCKHCQAEIPAIHPILEFTGGLLLIYFLLTSQDLILSILAILFCGHLIIAITTDWTLFSLDYENTILAALIALCALARKSMLFSDPGQEWFLLKQNLDLLQQSPDALGLLFQFLAATVWIGPVLTALFALILTLPLHLWKPEGLGLGDVWLLVPLSLFLGMPYVLLPIILGSGWSVIQILFIQKDHRSPAPLGAFMAIGAILAVTIQFYFL